MQRRGGPGYDAAAHGLLCAGKAFKMGNMASKISQHHFPDRLEKALLINCPGAPRRPRAAAPPVCIQGCQTACPERQDLPRQVMSVPPQKPRISPSRAPATGNYTGVRLRSCQSAAGLRWASVGPAVGGTAAHGDGVTVECATRACRHDQPDVGNGQGHARQERARSHAAVYQERHSQGTPLPPAPPPAWVPPSLPCPLHQL